MSLEILKGFRDESPVEIHRTIDLTQPLKLAVGQAEIPPLKLTISMPTLDEAVAIESKYPNRRAKGDEGTKQAAEYRRDVGRLIVRGWSGLTRETITQVSSALVTRPALVDQLPEGEIEYSPDSRDVFMDVVDGMVVQDLLEAAINTQAFAIEQARAKKK